MKEILLQATLGNPRVEAIIQKVLQVYEEAFPGQIVACYLEGSYADQTSLPTSDIDLLIIFRDRFVNEAARGAAEQTWESRDGEIQDVDISVVDEDSLRGGIHPSIKLGGHLIYGQDICAQYPLLPIEVWTRERMHAAYWLLINVYQRPTPVRLPLTFPSATDEFYGYMNRTLRLPDGREVSCTRNLVRTTGWIATALLALQAGQYVGRKRDCTRLYREHIGDEWSSLPEEIIDYCRDEWQYLIPTASQERQHLREVCERTLRFEQHFIAHYKAYLLEQLSSTDPEHVHMAARFQEQVPLDDTGVIAALQMPD